MLDLTADGVKLTPGGRLPRAFVRQVQQQRPEWAWSDRPAAREDDLIPLLALHDVLREVGLLRLRKGVLQPIKAAPTSGRWCGGCAPGSRPTGSPTCWPG